MKKNKNIQQVNFVHLSGQSYSFPIELTGADSNSSGQWIIRKIKVIIAPNQWIDFVFENVDLWNWVKDLPIGNYIEVIGKFKNTFSRKYRGDNSQIIVEKIVYMASIKTTEKEKFLMSLEKIEERKKKNKAKD